jgi:hypothetical protein
MSPLDEVTKLLENLKSSLPSSGEYDRFVAIRIPDDDPFSRHEFKTKAELATYLREYVGDKKIKHILFAFAPPGGPTSGDVKVRRDLMLIFPDNTTLLIDEAAEPAIVEDGTIPDLPYGEPADETPVDSDLS